MSGVRKQVAGVYGPRGQPGRWNGGLRFIDPQREAGLAGSKDLDKMQILFLLTGAPLAYAGERWNPQVGLSENRDFTDRAVQSGWYHLVPRGGTDTSQDRKCAGERFSFYCESQPLLLRPSQSSVNPPSPVPGSSSESSAALLVSMTLELFLE